MSTTFHNKIRNPQILDYVYVSQKRELNAFALSVHCSFEQQVSPEIEQVNGEVMRSSLRVRFKW